MDHPEKSVWQGQLGEYHQVKGLRFAALGDMR
jgi:hypothetical protein